MHGEQGRTQPRALHTGALENAPEQDRAKRMQRHVRDVKTRGVIAPRQPLQPERDRAERKVTLKPDGKDREFAVASGFCFTSTRSSQTNSPRNAGK